MTYGIITILVFSCMLLYFRIADHYNIIDHPNERSSHSDVTIRGGGVIFLLAAICAAILHPGYWLPVSGTLIIGIISFVDDRFTISSRLRLLFHLLAVTIMFIYLNVFHIEPFYVCILLYIMVIGIINMYNFMDGINGITGAYSLVVLGGLQYINLRQVAFVHQDMIWLPMLADGVFLYFNFRKKAKCFAGDVGSVTIAFWIIMLLIQLIFITHNWAYILFLVVYGIDSVVTIIHRLLLRQNIFKAHRLHFYQILSNERNCSHLWVAFGYSLLQAVIIVLIINRLGLTTSSLFMITIIPLVIIYVSLKPILMKKDQ
ncbi:MAG: UDP-GlcNAc--UDP-phosphate GlcNAc-phosphate transferase [Mucilaginibacter sp.]|nr:UDP-GlcNAc--UDP-phosphate GlcNAc-phosphate transferase [Mucilaginibacter sp.]